MADNPCATLEPWLRSLTPRQELVTRLALRWCFEHLIRDRVFMDRLVALTNELHPTDDELEAVLRDATAVQARIEKLADHPEAIAAALAS